ncbi:MAG: MFS transporter [Betaproteobacteria bacterium]|nr:MFS transporter [Betaproteobacteria bacterium]
MDPQRMSAQELRAGASLAGIFGLRMLGLFLILPVFAVHAPQLAGGDDLVLVGVALGAYGLVQAILQLPFGMASDRWGRKPVMVIGLALFAAGSFLAAGADDIWTAIAGRGLQGAGAISAVVMALAADLTRDQHRVKIMAMIGATIGASFALSLVAAPTLYHVIGMGGLFALTGVLALAGIGVLLWLVPDVPRRAAALTAGAPRELRKALLDPQLARLNAGIFVLHMVQMAMFVVVPPLLVAAGLPLQAHWKIYLPVVLVSFALMLPPILHADRRNAGRGVMLGAIALLLVAEGGLALSGPRVAVLALAMLGFFCAFNVLEALIPSLVSRLAPAHARGTAIGIYNTAQTLGLFCGGLLGGWVAGRYGAAAVFGSCAALALGWLAIAYGMRPVNRIGGESFTMSTVKGR